MPGPGGDGGQTGLPAASAQVMATRGMFSTTDLIGPLAGRVIRLSSSQAYRLVVERQTAQPEDLDGVLDLLDCS